MAKKRKQNPNQVNDLSGFLTEFDDEDDKKGRDRSNVIVGATLLDEYLRRLIAAFLIDTTKSKKIEEVVNKLFEFNGSFGSFGARIKGAYCLGLISQDEFDNLEIIRDIRNVFAHQLHGLSLHDEWVYNNCNSLKIPELLMPNGALLGRARFRLAIIMLVTQLKFRTYLAKKKCCSIPSGFDWISEDVDGGMDFLPFDLDVLLKFTDDASGEVPKISDLDLPTGMVVTWRHQRFNPPW